VGAPGRPRSRGAPVAWRHPGPAPGRGPAPDLDAEAAPSADAIIHELVNAHELERRRIARDVHDIVGQALTSVRIHLEQVRRAPSPSATAAEIRRAMSVVDLALREVRDLAFEIRPQILDDLGLVSAARWFLNRQARAIGIRPTFVHAGVRDGLAVEIEAACFRALQEALANVARHAHATSVRVHLAQTEHELTLTVVDDGVGFDTRRLRSSRRRPSLGLIGISEHVSLVGGSLEVLSQVGAGTTVRVRIPIRDAEVPAW
jgi:two-component system sensor histidine kinase UhpB